MKFEIGGTAKVLEMPNNLKINEGENMVIVKNITGSEPYKEPQTLGFKDDEGKVHMLKSGETVECNYKRSMSKRLVIQKEEKAEGKKKKEAN